MCVDIELQSTSKSSSASTASSFHDKLPSRGSRTSDPFDDDFDVEDGAASHSNSSSQATGSAFDDQFPVSASQSQCSLAFSAGD